MISRSSGRFCCLIISLLRVVNSGYCNLSLETSETIDCIYLIGTFSTFVFVDWVLKSTNVIYSVALLIEDLISIISVPFFVNTVYSLTFLNSFTTTDFTYDELKDGTSSLIFSITLVYYWLFFSSVTTSVVSTTFLLYSS